MSIYNIAIHMRQYLSIRLSLLFHACPIWHVKYCCLLVRTETRTLLRTYSSLKFHVSNLLTVHCYRFIFHDVT
jgi:D-alanyl-D-alanine dipeptidase